MRLSIHDLNDIKLRHGLRQTRREDVDALLGELEACAEDVYKIALALDCSEKPDEIVSALQDRLTDEEDHAAEVREHEAFERGVFAMSAQLAGSPELRELFHCPLLAHPDEYCQICQIGHADEFGGCERHGKKVRGAWADTDGPTQTGAVLLIVVAFPLLDLICGIERDCRKDGQRLARARVASAQRLVKLSKDVLLEMARQRKVVVGATDTKAQIADKLAEVM